jgi:hypothetical protein
MPVIHGVRERKHQAFFDTLIRAGAEWRADWRGRNADRVGREDEGQRIPRAVARRRVQKEKTTMIMPNSNASFLPIRGLVVTSDGYELNGVKLNEAEVLDLARRSAMAYLGSKILTSSLVKSPPVLHGNVVALSPPPDGQLVRYAGSTKKNHGWWRTLLSWLGLR